MLFPSPISHTRTVSVGSELRRGLISSHKSGHSKFMPAEGNATKHKSIGRGHDTVGNRHRARISQFELFELILLLKLNKQLPVAQFEASRTIRGSGVSVSSNLPPSYMYSGRRPRSRQVTCCNMWCIIIFLYVYLSISLSLSIYIYIYRERERDSGRRPRSAPRATDLPPF